ncbi:MAG: hypothetical protein JWO37_53 [Acidimicrobiales bacterium]|jgi:hypothetical protein|nr:hypothetical protein [Acidimicrobiales bacterium]
MKLRRGLRSRLGRTVVACVAVAIGPIGLVAAATPTAADGPLPLECTGAGSVNVAQPASGPAAWAISGAGFCTGKLNQSFTMKLAGTGTSDSLGLCSAQPLVTNLNLTVAVTITGPVDGSVHNQTQKWSLPVTTFPVTDPFAISTGGSPIGLGTIWTRIFAQCPNGGSPAATFDWTQQF